MASVFGSEFPDGMLPQADQDNGWTDLHYERSHALFVDYTFRTDGRGFFCGPAVFLYDNTVQHGPSGTTAQFRSIYPNVRVGYTWFPFTRAGFYLSPWLNMGTEVALDPTGTAEGPKYEVPGFKYVAALHVGYRYTFK